jgi:hypothetical protein
MEEPTQVNQDVKTFMLTLRMLVESVNKVIENGAVRTLTQKEREVFAGLLFTSAQHLLFPDD